MLIIEADVAVQSRLQILALAEVVTLQHLFNAAVEPLDHTAGLGQLCWSQAVHDVQGGAERVALVLARGSALSQTEETIRELLAVVRENGADAELAGAFQIS